MGTLLIDKLLQTVCSQKASDLHLTVGSQPMLRLHGHMRPLATKVLEPSDTVSLMKSIAPERCQQELQEVGGTDFGFAFGDMARFRVAIYKQRGNVGLVLRRIPNEFLTFEQLGLPPIVESLITRPRGLILVTGPTGSGKTTSLASMINWINATMDRHIITIEDPIEYFHKHNKSLINQREIGIDVPDFPEAIRRALRMDPDIILVGEMRDLETIELAITAAATGHLVFGTLHTQSAAKTVDRIIDVFPADQQNKIRQTLSEALKGIVAQTLFKRSDKKGRVAAFEVLVFNTAVANLVREGKTHQIQGMIQVGKKFGNQQLDDHIMEHVRMKRITAEDAYDKALDKKKFRTLLAHPPEDEDTI